MVKQNQLLPDADPIGLIPGGMALRLLLGRELGVEVSALSLP
jgi:hypothetical protein